MRVWSVEDVQELGLVQHNVCPDGSGLLLGAGFFSLLVAIAKKVTKLARVEGI